MSAIVEVANSESLTGAVPAIDGDVDYPYSFTILFKTGEVPTSYSASQYVCALHRSANYTTNVYSVRTNAFTTGSSAIYASGPNGTATSTGGTVVQDTWHSIVVACVSATEKNYYFDGTLIESETATNSIFGDFDEFWMGGCSPTYSPAELSGSVAGAFVTSDEITAAEASSLYNSGSFADPTTVLDNIVAGWHLYDDNSAHTGTAATENGTITYSTGDHPYTISAGGGATGIEVIQNYYTHLLGS